VTVAPHPSPQGEFIETVRHAVEFNGARGLPLYRRLQRGIRHAIDIGAIGQEDALPSERDLATLLGVSRITIRRAVQELAEEGLLSQRQGAGTFVTPRVEQPLSRLTSYTEDMTARGLVSTVQWLNRSVTSASPDEALALNLSPGSKVSRLYRLRFADNRPMCLEQATLPQKFLPDPEAVNQSLYAALDQNGCRPVRALQRLRAELFSPEHAALLGVQAGSACLYIERRSFLADGTSVELVRSHYRGDSYDFVAELQL
jgi:GntR family transcriptional regulator